MPNHPRHRARARTALAPVALATFLLCGGVAGCVAPAAINYKLFGPPPVPARYTPPKTEPMLVLVENPHSGALAIPESDELSRVIFRDLEEHKVAPQIDPGLLHDLRDRAPNAFAKMSIAEIGRALGAKQVLYVHVDRLDLDNPSASDMVKTRMSANVKVIDTATAMTTWPLSGEDALFEHETPHRRIESSTSASELKRVILREGAIEIARWFYAWKPETMRDENRDVKLR